MIETANLLAELVTRQTFEILFRYQISKTRISNKLLIFTYVCFQHCRSLFHSRTMLVHAKAIKVPITIQTQHNHVPTGAFQLLTEMQTKSQNLILQQNDANAATITSKMETDETECLVTLKDQSTERIDLGETRLVLVAVAKERDRVVQAVKHKMKRKGNVILLFKGQQKDSQSKDIVKLDQYSNGWRILQLHVDHLVAQQTPMVM